MPPTDKPMFCQVATNLDSNPKIRKAKAKGREVFLFALRRNAEPGNTTPGRLPAAELEPWFVADMLMVTESDARDGLRHAVEAELLARDGDEWVIVGWEDHWGKRAASGSERTAKWRKTKRVTNGDDVLTSRDDANVTRDASDASEKIREEKKREESSRTRAIPDTDQAPTPVHATDVMAATYDPQDPQARGVIARQIYQRVSSARIELGRRLGMPTLPELPDPRLPGSRPRAYRDCQERVAEEGHNAPTMCHRVVDELVAAASDANSIDWLGEKSFTEGAWRTARDRVGKPRATKPKVYRTRAPVDDAPDLGAWTLHEAIYADPPTTVEEKP